MAEELGVVLSTYRDYEYGEYSMRIDRAEKFSEIVKIPIGNIFFAVKLHEATSE